MNYGIQYTVNQGTMEPYDYWFFFAPFYRTLSEKFLRRAESSGRQLPRRVVYYPRRGFDLWGSRYFIVPAGIDARDEYRGVLSFLMPPSEEVASSPLWRDDYRVLYNPAAFPRTWLVHQARVFEPVRGLRRRDRLALMELLLYQGDELWFDPSKELGKLDPAVEAVVEVPVSERPEVLRFAPGGAPSERERCRIVEYSPQRVVIEVQAERHGILILADVYFSGWRVSVDGRPRKIWRVNRMMRGVGIEPGRHRVVFSYSPWTFRFGGAVSCISVAALCLAAVLAGWRRLRSVSR
jgi:hypothetical protein